MKIVFLASLIGNDSEFPLIRELQKREKDFVCYFTLLGDKCNTSIFQLDNSRGFDGIIKASKYPEFKRFEKYFDLERIYIVSFYHWRQRNWQSWLTRIKLYMHIRRLKPDVFHYSWPLIWHHRLLYKLKCKKVMTVHDPIPHSSLSTEENERNRLIAFSYADRFLLLNRIQVNDFTRRYNIDVKRLSFSRFGYYDWMDYLGKPQINQQQNVLFWGQIQSHKGVDVLLKAMLEVHKVNPELKCIIAGKGSFSFDIEPYLELDYIEIINRFISMEELSELLSSCLFVVCPYKDATQSGVVQNTFSMNVPMIVTNVGALPVSVTDGVTGLVVPPNNVDSLRDAIIKLSTDSKLRESFKENIANIWKKENDWISVGNDYMSCYKLLVSSDNS